MNPDIKHNIQSLLDTQQRQILGIVGAPGAGKSTLVAQIVEQFGSQVVVLPMDGFHLADAELRRLGRDQRKGAPDTFDAAGFVSLLSRVRHQTDEVIYAPEFDRSLEAAIAGSIAIAPETPLVIVEGNYLLLQTGEWRHVRPLLDLSWYVDVDESLRVSRLIERHVQFGRTLEAARAWVMMSDEPNARLIEECKPLADWLLPWV